jgi:hypothetical protein
MAVSADGISGPARAPLVVGHLDGSNDGRRPARDGEGSCVTTRGHCRHGPVRCSGFDLLYAFIIVWPSRRELVWTNVTANPTAKWVARQITEALLWDETLHYLIQAQLLDLMFQREWVRTDYKIQVLRAPGETHDVSFV